MSEFHMDYTHVEAPPDSNSQGSNENDDWKWWQALLALLALMIFVYGMLFLMLHSVR